MRDNVNLIMNKRPTADRSKFRKRHCALTAIVVCTVIWYGILPSWRLLRRLNSLRENSGADSSSMVVKMPAHPESLSPNNAFVGESVVLQPPTAWIVQGDSTPLPQSPSPHNMLTINTTDWMNLMAAINFRYSRQHNYGYTRFVFEDKDQCTHPVFGVRHIAWCKLLAIAQIMETIPRTVQHVLWIDSDAMLQQQDHAIPSLIDSLEIGCMTGCNTTACHDFKHGAALLTAANNPFCGEPPLTAFQIWNVHSNSNDTRRLLPDWWNSPLCGNEHPWEQRAFARDVYPHHALSSKIGILFADINHPNKPEVELRKQYIRHVGHFASWNNVSRGRLPQAQNVANFIGLQDSEYRQLQHKLLHEQHHVELLTTNQMRSLSEKLWGGVELLTNNLSNDDCKYVVNGEIHPLERTMEI